MEEQQYSGADMDAFSDISVKIRDIEDRQNMIKDRVLLIGENLVSEKEQMNTELEELKSAIMNVNEEIKRIKFTLERVFDDSNNFARKNEFQMLQKQFEMFRPLELARMSDVRKMISAALKK